MRWTRGAMVALVGAVCVGGTSVAHGQAVAERPGVAASVAVDHASAPIVGITMSYAGTDEDVLGGTARVSMAYVEAVRAAGAVPILIPPGAADDDRARQAYMEMCDGLLLIGGLDIPPEAYGEPRHPTVSVLPQTRWLGESRLASAWLDGEKPMLGVCLGAQMMTVVSGGSLIQDVPSEVGEGTAHGGGSRHFVDVTPGTRLAEIMGAGQVEVNSYHHQATDDLGDGFVVAARASDGVIEAIERPGPRFVLGVQWHPERLTEEGGGLIFEAFVDAVREEISAPVMSR